MANPLWPNTLPQSPYGDGTPEISKADGMIRSNVDAGPAKQRRRYTAVPAKVSFQIVLNETEYAALETFRVVTLKEALPFDWVDFHSGNAATYRFTGPPIEKFFADDMWTLQISLEKLP